MSSLLSYKGYTARIEFSSEDGCFVGHIQDLRRNPFSERNYVVSGCEPGRENGFLEPSCVSPNIVGIKDIVGFHGESVAELKAAFEEAGYRSASSGSKPIKLNLLAAIRFFNSWRRKCDNRV